MNLSLRYQTKPLKHGDADTCTCPHCWTVFPLEDALYVSRHPDLLGDPVLGSDAPSRFKPTRFTAEGHAIDPGGYPCLEMACPNCHLEVPRSLAVFKTHFFSIIGTPSSGKSFFLGTLAWELRRIMPAHFGMSFSDLETGLNEVLHSYEDTLFFAKDRERYVSIKKTEQQGELYNRVNFGGTETLLPKPFVITLRPQPHHPQFARESEWTRTLVLYDNAGEHFDPRADTVQQPGTMHMAKSECLFFILDPTQDPRFRERVHGHPDPQLGADFRVQRQDVVFNEAARRIRRHLGIPPGKKYHKNVIVVVNKCDIWQSLLKTPIDADPFLSDPKFPVKGINTSQVEDVSFSVRWLLQDICPEVVTAVEDFADHVVYVPVSALGHSPTRNPKTLALEVRPIDIRPKWITVPFLYAFSKLGLVYRAKRPSTTHATARVVRRFGGRFICSLPDESQIEVPERYAGCVLHHPLSGIGFIVPKAATAFAISHDGLMLTNRHVVEDHIRLTRAKALKDDLARTAKIQVEERLWVFVNGEKLRGELVFASDQFDGAVIRVPHNFARVFKLSASNRVALDEEVRAAGFPQAGDVRVSLSDAEAVQRALNQRQLHGDARNYFGARDLDFVLTSGRVSRSTRDDAKGTYWIQHNADVNPGNSGGPLITSDGTVVAINTIAINAASGMYFSLATGQLRDELMKLKGDITWSE